MNVIRAAVLFTVLPLALTMTACKSVPREAAVALSDVDKVAWSFKDFRNGMAVNVSPTGNALRFGGSAGLVVGTSVDAVANDRYRQQIAEALAGWDVGGQLAARLDERLAAAYGGELAQVAPLGSTTRHASRREGEAARLDALAKQGYGQLLDLEVGYGIYGAGGALAVQIEARQYDLESGKLTWRRNIVADTEPVLATAPLGDPIAAAMTPSVANARLKAESDAVSQWTADGGAPLREAFGKAIDEAIAALLCGANLAQDAGGFYTLAKGAMHDKQFPEADRYFAQALALEPGSSRINNGRAVNFYHNKQLAEAVALGEEVVASAPDFGPGWINLALYHAEAGAAERAAECYAKAQALGLEPVKKVDKALEQSAG